MLVHSKIDNSQWLWINIPKTASTLVRNSIFGYEDELDGQTHYTYVENVEMYGKHTGFTVIRNPLSRFISGLNHIFSECACNNCIIFHDRPPNTHEVISFLNEMVLLSKSVKDFHYKTYYNGSNSLWMEILKLLQKNFLKSRIIADPVNCVMWSFILPQFVYLDEMEVRDYIFRYEQLDSCAEFIKNRLGYEVNTRKRTRQYSYKLSEVDFTDVNIKNLIYQYYEEDYKQLKY